jgi:hypothetical protein
MTLSDSNIQSAYDLARERYAAFGVDTGKYHFMFLSEV